MMDFYGYKRCSTCRKALAWLAGHGFSPVEHDITRTPPSADLICLALTASWKDGAAP